MALENSLIPRLTREEIARIFGPNPRAVRAYEALQNGLSIDVINAINAAQDAADAAQLDADAAQAAADAAQVDADAALAAIAALSGHTPVYMQDTEPPATSIWFKTDPTSGLVIDIMQVTP